MQTTIIVSAQKDYINKNADTFLYIATGILQIIIICVWKSYIASLIVKLIFTVLNNLYLYIKAGKMFPYLNDKNLHGEIEKEVWWMISVIAGLVVALIIGIVGYRIFFRCAPPLYLVFSVVHLFQRKPMIEKEFEATLRNLFLNDHRAESTVKLFSLSFCSLSFRNSEKSVSE